MKFFYDRKSWAVSTIQDKFLNVCISFCLILNRCLYSWIFYFKILNCKNKPELCKFLPTCLLVLGVHHIYLKTLSGHIPDFVKSFGEFMVYKEFARWSREDCDVLRDFQDFPDRLVSKNVAPQHAWPRNENERSGQLIAITAKLAAKVPTFPIPIAIYWPLEQFEWKAQFQEMVYRKKTTIKELQRATLYFEKQINQNS